MGIFGRLFRRKQNLRLMDIAASVEVENVKRRLDAVFNRNTFHFYNDVPGSLDLAVKLVLAPKQRDIPGLFALGIIMETIEHFPPLPTAPYDRAFIHLMNFLMNSETPFVEAQIRTLTVKEQLESLDKHAAYLVSQGRDAANNEDQHTYLASCYAASERYNLLSGNF